MVEKRTKLAEKAKPKGSDRSSVSDARTDLERRIAIHLTELTPNDYRIAKYFVAEFPQVAFASAQDIADRLDVSKAAVVRCANRLGYQGFTQLRKVLQRYVNVRLESPLELLEEHRAILQEEASSMVTERMRQAFENMRAFTGTISAERLDQIVERLARSNRVVVAGERKSWGLATYFGDLLRMLRPRTEIWPGPAQPLSDMALDLGPEDALVVLTFRRYSRAILDLARAAREREAWVLALTDSVVAPVVGLASEAIACPAEDVSFVDSMVVPVFAIEILAARLSRELGPSVHDRLEQMEQYAEASGFFAVRAAKVRQPPSLSSNRSGSQSRHR